MVNSGVSQQRASDSPLTLSHSLDDNLIYSYPISPSITCNNNNNSTEILNLTIEFTSSDHEEDSLRNVFVGNQTATAINNSSVSLGFENPFYSNFTLNITCTRGGAVHLNRVLNYRIVLSKPEPPSIYPKIYSTLSAIPLTISMSPNGQPMSSGDQAIGVQEDIMYYLIHNEEKLTQDNFPFLTYEIPFTIMASSSETLVIHLVAKTIKTYPNGLVLESALVSGTYEIPPQCNSPVASKKSGTYFEDVISIRFETSSVEQQIYCSLDDNKFELVVNGSIEITNDGQLHSLKIYSISSTCYPSPVIEWSYQMKQIISLPTMNPLPDTLQGNLLGSQLMVSCSHVAKTHVECYRNSILIDSNGTLSVVHQQPQTINQTLSQPLNLTCRCSHNEKIGLNSEWLTNLYINLYNIPKPILSVLSTTHVGPLEIVLQCDRVFSTNRSCDGFVYTTESSITTITKPNMIGTTTLLILKENAKNNSINNVNETINYNYTTHTNESSSSSPPPLSKTVITLKNQGLNNLKVVAFDSKTGEVSPQIEEQYFLIGLIGNPRINLSPSLETGESIESKLFINSVVVVVDFENLDAVAADILIINNAQTDASSVSQTKLTPFTLVLEYNCTVKMNFTKLHHLPSSEFTFSVHVKQVKSNNIFASFPIVLTSSLKETLFNVQVVLVVVGLFALALVVSLIVLVIIVKKRRNYLHNKKLEEYDAHFENVVLHSSTRENHHDY